MCLYEKVDHHGTIISQMRQNALFRVSNGPPPIPYPPPRQRRVEGAEVPCYIALMASQFHSPSTSKFGENPVHAI